jgi:hypothetical protein
MPGTAALICCGADPNTSKSFMMRGCACFKNCQESDPKPGGKSNHHTKGTLNNADDDERRWPSTNFNLNGLRASRQTSCSNTVHKTPANMTTMHACTIFTRRYLSTPVASSATRRPGKTRIKVKPQWTAFLLGKLHWTRLKYGLKV